MRKYSLLLPMFVFNSLLGWVSLSASPQSNADHSLQGRDQLSIAVDVSNATYDCAKGISFDWQIKNTSRDAVYIYTPFLEGPSANLLEYDRGTDTVLIPTSLKSEVTYPPYSYPKATFRQLAPGETFGGNFHEPISHQLSCKSLHPKYAVFEVAWGTETSQVLKEIAQVKKVGLAHPANPLVRWARLADSGSVPLKYVE